MWGARCTLGPHQPSQISWINGKSLWQRLGPFSVSDRSHSWLSARLGRMHCRRARVDGPAAQIDRGCGVRDGRQEQALGGRPPRSVPGRVRAGADWCRRRNGGSRPIHKPGARLPPICAQPFDRTDHLGAGTQAGVTKCPLAASLTVPPPPRVSTRPQPSRAASLAKRGGVAPVPCLHDGEIELGRQRACDDDIPAQGVVEVACGLTMSIART
jgi:hypothetical protein